MTQRCVKVQLWYVKVAEIGPSMSIFFSQWLEMVLQKNLNISASTASLVRQFYDAGLRYEHECLTHIMDIDAPFPEVVGSVLQLISA